MTIKIIEEPTIHLTRAEMERLQHEYNQSILYRAGYIPSFETWVRNRKNAEKKDA